jgi:glycosyltransferase involved in cell wall biosynthesis
MGARALPWAERAGLPLVVTFHGHDVPVLGNTDRFRPRYLEYGLRAPRMLAKMTLGLCASRELRELLIEVGAPADRLVVHTLGVDLARFARREPAGKRAASEPLTVMMVGRFVAKKGFAYGLRAFAQARRATGKDARLVLVGDGVQAPALRALVAELGLGEQVELAGVLTPDQLAARLARADVLLAPSVTPPSGDRESGLMVVKEACAAGVVPVGTWHGGIPEIIVDGQTGFLVGERDVDALAERLGRLLVDAKLRGKLAVAARARMEAEYDVQKRVDRLEELYDEAVRRHAARAARVTRAASPDPAKAAPDGSAVPPAA